MALRERVYLHHGCDGTQRPGLQQASGSLRCCRCAAGGSGSGSCSREGRQGKLR